MLNNIIKAEVLLTRKCNLRCSYCSIIRDDDEKPPLSMEGWELGFNQLQRLGIEFVAIYGGEPTVEFERLKKMLEILHRLEIPNTIITNAITLTEERFDELVEAGLRSLTVSVDSMEDIWVDKHIQRRASKSMKLLDYAQSKYGDLFRDFEISFTVNRQNFKELPDIIDYFTKRDVWVSFDVIHYDKGTPGSKTASKEKMIGYHLDIMDNEVKTQNPLHPEHFEHLFDMIGNSEVYAIQEDLDQEIREVMAKVYQMKKDGFLIHQTEQVLLMWQNPYWFRERMWQCSVPAWVSVDYDGSMLVCDDYISPTLAEEFSVIDIADRWEEFNKAWKKENTKCAGCMWSTHIMAEEQVISKLGGASITHTLAQSS